MSVELAYGPREYVDEAVAAGKIPPESLIATSDGDQSELFYLDNNKRLRPISERTKFLTFTEASEWIKKHDCVGQIVAVHNGNDWVPYIVSQNNSLSPIGGGSGSIGDIKVIDGGNAAG